MQGDVKGWHQGFSGLAAEEGSIIIILFFFSLLAFSSFIPLRSGTRCYWFCVLLWGL